MNTRRMLAITMAATLLVAGGARAQDDDSEGIDTLDLTIELMPDGATLPEAVTRVIELPEVAADAARENAARGLEIANEARQNGEGGLAIAAEARERGLEQAQEDRENAGRGPPEGVGPPDGIPQGPPDDLPGGPPENLPGPPPNAPAGN